MVSLSSPAPLAGIAHRPKLFAELLTGKNMDTNDIRDGITHRVAGMGNTSGKPHAKSVFPALTDLLRRGKFKPLVRVIVAGKDSRLLN